MDDLYSLLTIFGLIILNGTFVAAEFSIARVRKTHVDHIVHSTDGHYSKGKIKTAKLVQKILSNINDYISACQVGITIVSLALGVMAEARIEGWISPLISQFNIGIDPHTISILLAITLVTFFHVIIGEVVPKNIAIINPEKVSFRLAYFLRFLYIVFKLPVRLLNVCSNFCLGVLGIDLNFDDTAHSEAEIKMILSSSQEQGVLEEEEEQLMQNVFELNDTIARDVMIPRSDMICINDKLTIEEAGIEANKTTFSRFPLYHGKIDNIVGYITIKDVLTAYQRGDILSPVTSIANETLKVSDGMYVIDLLKLMQENKKQIAVLIDEFGGTCGLVTAEDIVEEIFGEIDDEDEAATQAIQKLANGDFLVDGLLNIKDVNEELGTNFKSSRYDTIGGYVFGLIGTEPKPGDTVESNGHTLRVEKHADNRVRQVRVMAKH